MKCIKSCGQEFGTDSEVFLLNWNDLSRVIVGG